MTGHEWFGRQSARDWVAEPLAAVSAFHESLPGYAPTRLIDVPPLAVDLGVARVLVKEESSRLGLPAFKILGASYAIARALARRLGLDEAAPSLDRLRGALAEAPPVVLYAATDGNHGRAVAHMARLLGVHARISVPAGVTVVAQEAIAGEGAQVTEFDLGYDEVVAAASDAADSDPAGLLIQDTSWPGYEQVPQWVVDGYATLFEETDRQLAQDGIDRLDLVVVPIGVGSLGQAAVRHYRSSNRSHRSAVLSVEPVSAPAIIESLHAGRAVDTGTGRTIMNGLNCGAPSRTAWPVLRAGLDAAVTVTDDEAARAVHDLDDLGVDAGPCGAATLAGIRRALSAGHRGDLGIDADSVILLISTEGRQANPLPEEDRR